MLFTKVLYFSLVIWAGLVISAPTGDLVERTGITFSIQSDYRLRKSQSRRHRLQGCYPPSGSYWKCFLLPSPRHSYPHRHGYCYRHSVPSPMCLAECRTTTLTVGGGYVSAINYYKKKRGEDEQHGGMQRRGNPPIPPCIFTFDSF